MRSLYRLVPVAIAAALSLSILSGCAKAPVEELAAVKAAIKAAQAVEGDKYMPNNFSNVQRALESAQAEIALQQGKAFPPSRNYGKAKGLLANALELATEIKTETPGAKTAMKAQVESNLVAAREIAKETGVDLKRAPRSKVKDMRS